jgi:glyoxylate/hydroxypyruvate reductase A
MRVVLSLPGDAEACWLDLLRTALPGAQVIPRLWDSPVDPAAPVADYVVAYGKCGTLFDEQRRPRAIFTLSAGVRHLLTLPNLPRDVPIIRLEDAGMAEQMIRYVLSAALRVVQHLDIYARQQREARWEQHDPRLPSSLKAGVMGLGVIGAQVARALAAHGFSVRGYARSAKDVDGVAVFAGESALDAFLDDLDFLVCVLPATPATEGVLDRRTLSRLADGAHVVNIGRGASLVEEDLVALLESGKIAGATLDVFCNEPLPADHPFWRWPEIVVTPHVSGLTVPDAAIAQIADKIMRLERGEPVSGGVAFERGY